MAVLFGVCSFLYFLKLSAGKGFFSARVYRHSSQVLLIIQCRSVGFSNRVQMYHKPSGPHMGAYARTRAYFVVLQTRMRVLAMLDLKNELANCNHLIPKIDRSVVHMNLKYVRRAVVSS